ncbi:molybdopterin cofactor-binding domain-containing protein [Rhodosalinus sp.]|uniref:xanthine dehydrogenase family protein molybdopterin-binding subunit n=1 Tax=Rhodosalinus sp. TaxID=2047741 RepID=UPI00397CCEDA
MASIGKIARRSFLVGSVAVAGGVAFGYWRYRAPYPNPLEPGEGAVALNPWVVIDGEGVTLITPRADKGQGAVQVQAALLAEELDVDPAEVRTSFGPPAPVYYNSEVVSEGMPVAASDDGIIARLMRGGVSDAAGKFLGMQVTGGSTTVPDGYEKLRRAGAVARETLKRAAAARTGTDVAELRTDAGQVVLPDGTAIPYSDLASEAAEVEAPDFVALRDPSEWRILGQAVQRIDMAAKCTGTQDFGIDHRQEGLLHATVRTHPGWGDSVAAIDSREAEGMRGVERIVQITGGVGVIADNTWRAMRAAEAVRIDWGPSPIAESSDAMWDEFAGSFTDDRRDSRFKDEGDVEAALEGAEVLEAEYRVPFLAHAPLEPMNATVQVGGDRVDVWTGTQIPRFVQDHVAEIVGVRPGQVHVHNMMIGGSFGHRLEDLHVRQAAEVAMRVPGRPVKMTWSREEDMAHDFPRTMQLARMRGAVRDGRVEAYDLSIAAHSTMASQGPRSGIPASGPDVAIVAGAWDQPFAIPNYRVTGYRVPGGVPVSSWRSVGASGNGFLHDGFLDELIHAAGADPLEERIRLCRHAPSRRVLEALGEMCGWDGPTPGEGRGRGVAYCLSFGVPTAEVVEVTATGDGIRIDAVYIAAEVGRVLDPVNFEAQMTGGALFGLGHAMFSELTFAGHRVEQRNYDLYETLRLPQVPRVIEARALETTEEIRGIGEPPVPPAAPALANAIFAATGQRLREMPFSKSVRFV